MIIYRQINFRASLTLWLLMATVATRCNANKIIKDSDNYNSSNNLEQSYCESA